jgi:uncharacterized integral membrane protein
MYPSSINFSEEEYMNWKYIAIIVVLVYFAFFLISNSAGVDVNFLIFKVTTSKAALIIFSAVLGFVIGSALSSFRKKKATPQKK